MAANLKGLEDQKSHYATVFWNRVKRLDSEPAMKQWLGEDWLTTSWRELGEKVKAAAGGLIHLGLKEFSNIPIYSENEYRWTIVDFACVTTRTVLVPIHSTASFEYLSYILNEIKSEVIFIKTQEQYDNILKFDPDQKIIKSIIAFDRNIDTREDSRFVSFESFLRFGTKDEYEKEVMKRSDEAQLDDLFTIVYTSGTTGSPKGVMLTHKALTAQIITHHTTIPDKDELVSSFSLLPMSHIFERTWVLYVFERGMVNHYADIGPDIISIVNDAAPHALCLVPRVLEKVYDAVHVKLQSKPLPLKMLLYWGINHGKENLKRIQDEKPRSKIFKMKQAFAQKLILDKIAHVFGPNISMCVCGGAAISEKIETFFVSAGMFVNCGYGLTETFATVCHYPYKNITGKTVGKKTPFLDIKIASDGELLVKGDNVMTGYYNDPKGTKKVFDEDGYFMTGDIGEIDKDGFITLTDRKKDIFKNSLGKYIFPQKIETLLASDNFIENAAVFGQDQTHLAALLVPDMIKMEEYAKNNKIDYVEHKDLLEKSEVVDYFRDRVDKMLTKLPKYEQVKKFKLLDKSFTIEGGELTPTLKVRRAAIKKKFTEEIEKLFEK